MKEKQKDDWEELIRSDLLPYNVSVPFHSIKYSNEFLGGPKYEKLLLYLKDGVGYYYENFKDHNIVGDYCLKLFLKDKKRFKKYLKFWHDEFRKLNDLLARIKETDLKKLKPSELANFLQKTYEQSVYWEGVAYNVDAIDTVLNPLMQKVIEKVYPSEKKSRHSIIYNKLAFPEVLSYVNRMNLEKLGLFKEMAEKGLEKTKNKMARFVESYYWVNFEWGKSVEYTEKDLRDEFKSLTHEETGLKLAETKNRFEKALEEKKFFVNEIAGKQPIIKDYIFVFDEYAVLHDLRKEGQVKSACYLRKLYHEAARRLKVEAQLLYYYWPRELVGIIKENRPADLELLRKRNKGYFCEYDDDGRLTETFGDEALKKRDEAIGLMVIEQQELSGVGASQGRIIGKAKVCLSAKIAAEKIKEGDILVTGMTMPDFVPAMGKAAAIVTDEGGLTCHAAIIARELGKPCVVGTKMATRIIKDGDLLEVNANHGAVKIIERK